MNIRAYSCASASIRFLFLAASIKLLPLSKNVRFELLTVSKSASALLNPRRIIDAFIFLDALTIDCCPRCARTYEPVNVDSIFLSNAFRSRKLIVVSASTCFFRANSCGSTRLYLSTTARPPSIPCPYCLIIAAPALSICCPLMRHSGVGSILAAGWGCRFNFSVRSCGCLFVGLGGLGCLVFTGPYRLRNCSKVSSEPSSRTSFAMASRAPYLSTSRLKYGTLPGPSTSCCTLSG